MRLVLQLGADWRLSADRYCYALERRKTPRTGAGPRHERHAWTAEGFYTNPHEALRALWRIQARAISAESVEALAEAYRDAADRICDQLSEVAQ